jgi:hypothetical protein
MSSKVVIANYIIEKLEALKKDNDNKKILSDLKEIITNNPNIDNKELLLLSMNIVSQIIDQLDDKLLINKTIDGIIDSQKYYIKE